METLYLGTDHVLELPQLTNGLTGAVVTGANVTVTLYDAFGSTVSGQDWPLVLVESSNPPGRYYGTLSAELVIKERENLIAKVVANAGVGLKRTWVTPIKARI